MKQAMYILNSTILWSGEHGVTYRGIFLNDEARVLPDGKNTYGTNYGDHRFLCTSM